ncbi:MAG: UDP-2,3-diacylglucosamine pyrophosphatase LpxH, partial [Gammaproteobacteria bacterium]
FPVNACANERAFKAYGQLKEHAPAFIVHLGDMVHPLPHMSAYEPATAAARALFDSAQVPVHYVAGNHDIGDKPMPGSPAAVISDESIATYHKAFGKDFYSFNHESCCFVVVNSSLWNSVSRQEEEQYQWLMSTLEAHVNERIFVFSHYPHFIHDANEEENYDNIAEPARSRLLSLFENHSVESVFSGHVHNFFYNCTVKSRHYILPATSFVRQDYAELFRVPPVLEHGRDDTNKYFVTLVDVCEDDHSLRLVPIGDGPDTLAEPGDARGADKSEEGMPEMPLQVHLRHAWYEDIDLPYNGPMEEFSRKRARNDYTLLRLWQLGIRDVRVPVKDVMDEVISQRMSDYLRAGIRFHGFGSPEQFKTLNDEHAVQAGLLESLELISSENDTLADLVLPESISSHKIFLGQAATGRDSQSDGLYFHSVSSGFRWPLTEDRERTVLSWIGCSRHRGMVFQLPWESELSVLDAIDAWCAHNDVTGMINIRLAKQNPAHSNIDDEAIEHRIYDILTGSPTRRSLQYQLDTFADVDRGYSPRNGLIDRHFNLRRVGNSLIRWKEKAID